MTTDHSSVCFDEAHTWRRCIEANLMKPKEVDAACQQTLGAFDSCVAKWRVSVGPEVQVKGENRGDPPPQCQSHSCLIGECLRRTGYDMDKCQPPLKYFKHCVKALYGSEYVT